MRLVRNTDSIRSVIVTEGRHGIKIERRSWWRLDRTTLELKGASGYRVNTTMRQWDYGTLRLSVNKVTHSTL